MDMIRLDCQCENGPALLFALDLEKFLTAIFELTSENGLSSLRAPDEMVDNQVDPVFVSLVLKLARICRFHLQDIQHFRQPVKPNGLAAGSSSVMAAGLASAPHSFQTLVELQAHQQRR